MKDDKKGTDRIDNSRLQKLEGLPSLELAGLQTGSDKEKTLECRFLLALFRCNCCNAHSNTWAPHGSFSVSRPPTSGVGAGDSAVAVPALAGGAAAKVHVVN